MLSDMTRVSRRRFVRGLAAASAPLLVHGDPPTSDVVTEYEDDEGYRLYSRVIAESWIWTEAKAESLVIAERTVSSGMCLQPTGKSAKLLSPALDDYRKRALRKWRLLSRFNLAKPFVLVSEEQLRTYFGQGGSGWKAFYKDYPNSGGYLFFSPIGFNANKDIAVLQVNHWCGGLCGSGSFSVLQKKDDEWKPLQWDGGSCGWAS